MNLLLIFIILNIINVILQTIKSIATIKCGKVVASVVNAIAYGLYTIVIVMTNYEIALWAKCLIVGATNLVGVYVVKTIEEKIRKDKLWKVETTFSTKDIEEIDKTSVPHNIIKLNDKYSVVNFYCPTQLESGEVKNLIAKYNGKYFASETKIL